MSRPTIPPSLAAFSLDDFPAIRPVAAPAPAPTRESTPAGTFADEDKGWTNLSGRARRDLAPMAQEQMQRLAAYLWEANMLANRLVELPVAYLLAEGVTISCANPERQGWINAWWNDPINKLALRLPEYVRDLGLFGELCIPVYTNDVNGHVRHGYLDPSLIDDVMTDPGNPAQQIGVRTKKDEAGTQRQFRVVVRADDAEVFAPAARAARATYSDGDAFYFRVNGFAAGRRGRSDLMAQMDFLDAYDEFMFDSMDRASDLDAYVWDVTLEGATPETVAERASEIQRPGRNSVRVHNSQEKWEALSPGINAADRSEAARLFRNHALGGATIPEHWFGGGGDVNRAAAAEMGDPFFKMATMRQTVLRHMLVEMASYVLWQRAKAAGQTPDWGDEGWRVTVQFPDLVTRDVAKLTSALQQVVAAAAAAVTQKLITRKTAIALIAQAAKRLDITIEPDEELAAVLEENPGASELDGPSDPTDPLMTGGAPDDGAE